MVSRAISAGIKAGARPLPEHAQISCISCIKRTVAIAEATDEGTACLFTQNVAHWLTAFSTIIARPCETPEEMASGVDQFIRRELACRWRRRSRRNLR